MTISPAQQRMPDQPQNPATPAPSKRRHKVKAARKQAVRLTAREYLPMAATIAFWALAALAIGHADTARLLAATVLLRAVIMLVQMTTIGPLKRRVGKTREIWRPSLNIALLAQIGSLGAATVVIALLALTMGAIGQEQIATALPLVALGLPARAWRAVDPKASNAYFRLFTSLSALAGGALAWAIGLGPAGFALAYGARDWIATLAMRLLPSAEEAPERRDDTPLGFAEIARHTVVTSRRLLTYRLTKNILTVFGPFGNFAARTGRGMGWHNRLEPYMPHRLSGFILFAALTAAGAALLATRSGEPAAMIVAAGVFQLSAVALNVITLWRFLPRRDDPNLIVEEDEDD